MTRADDTPRGDHWNAFGYIVAGVLMYGLIGFALDRWWGTSFMVPVGIMVGAALGLYMTWARFKAPPDSDSAPQTPRHGSSHTPGSGSTSTDHPTEPQR
ncbi:hypothetical protein BH09ACT12_BH09ACT12_14320 [soil metagenome]